MKAMLINVMSTIGVVTALGLLILSVAFFCNERGFHPLGKNAQRFPELTWFEKLFLSVFVGAITVFASLKDNPTNSPPLNLPPVGLVGNPSSSLLCGSNIFGSIDCDRVSAIDVTTNGVALTLHRPETNALEAVEVTVAGSTNLVAATWEAYTNVVFAADVTNVEVVISREMMAAHSVSNINFFAFIQSGDSDGDGIDDWFERFNLSTDPFDPDSDHDGMDDGWELSHGLDPGSSRDAWLDADDDGVANIEEYTHGTDPENPDTDGDGIADRDEIGWVKLKASAQLPLANENTVYICTPPVGMVSSGVYPFSLPFPVRLCGRTCTHGYADVKGVVHFQTADDTTVPSPLGDNEALPSSSLPDGISVAAYWDSLRLRGGVSSIGSPIGGLIDEPVHFIDGESGWVTFTSSRTVETKVSRGEAAFDWQLVNIGGIPFPPTPFYATGPHRIYTILADPVAPWSSDPNSSQCAWTNALEWACTHAAQASTFGEAAVGVTSAINSSGRFLYGTWDGSARYFESDVFDFRTLQLTECVRRLNGGNGNGQGVNCTDCAMFVMAFSNLLGCSLYCSQMQGDFDTNPFVAIGYTDWDSPFGNGQWHFIYHEVAWDGDCGDTDLVYDACLRYDGDDDPSSAPHVAVLPAGVVFSDGSPYAPLVYRERLAYPSSSGYGRCCACPGTRRRLDELQ